MAKGLCRAHYAQQVRGSTLAPVDAAAEKSTSCSFDGCSKPHYAHDLCNSHYQQYKKGQPLRPLKFKRLQVSGDDADAKRYWMRVEKGADDVCWTWKGTVTQFGYGTLRVGGRRDDGTYAAVSAHRFGWELHTKEKLHPDMTLDHLCRNKLCVNPSHLEVTSRRENLKRMHAFWGVEAELAMTKAENAALREEVARLRAICSTNKP